MMAGGGHVARAALVSACAADVEGTGVAVVWWSRRVGERVWGKCVEGSSRMISVTPL